MTPYGVGEDPATRAGVTLPEGTAEATRQRVCGREFSASGTEALERELRAASAMGRADLGPVGVYGRAESTAGTEASANAGAGLDGVQLGGEAFAGAKAGAAAGVDIGGIGVGATAEGWAGPGAEAAW